MKMSRRDKSIQEKVKQFFGKKEAISINFDKLRKELCHLSPETLKDLNAENNLNVRLKALKELYESVLTKRLEDHAVEALCKSIKDMLDSRNSIETRHIVFQFYTALILGQGEHLNIMRCYLFRLLIEHRIPDDTSPRLEMLKALTDNGKNISCFEEEIGPFLLRWFPDVIATEKSANFLSIVSNVIKFNAAYVDDEIIAGYIRYVYMLCSRTNLEDDIQECLNILEAILCYSHVPDVGLHRFIHSLCLTVNIEKFSPCSLKHMRNLLGTNIGHTCIFSLCCILQERRNLSSSALLRGAISYIGMALWGPNKVPTLIHPATAVLPSFLKALESRDSIVAYEVILSLQSLVKHGDVSQNFCWDLIFDIMEKVMNDFTLRELPRLSNAFHDLISVSEDNVSRISAYRLFKIIERCSESRNEGSVIKLIAYTVDALNPLRQAFIPTLHDLLEKYFRHERRSAVQLKALEAISYIRQTFGPLCEDDLVNQIILQYMSQLDTVEDVPVRKAAIELLITIGEECMDSWFLDVLVVFEKVMKLMFDNLSRGSSDLVEAHNFSDVVEAVSGLIKIFKKKLLIIPSNHCTLIYSLLANHLKLHYEQVTVYFDEVILIRKMILDFLLEFCSNSKKQIGLEVNGKLEFSSYLLCYPGLGKEGGSGPSSPGPSSRGTLSTYTLSFGEAFLAIVKCLKQESDWTNLLLVFQKLPKLLTNTALIHGCGAISSLCSTLCLIVNDRSRHEGLKNASSRVTRTDLQGYIYPCVSALTSYHTHMESHIQRMLIRCLQSGLVSRSVKICINGLMLCALEMQNSMVKLLPDVLLKLSKLSSTVGVAVSVLEFLSNLIRLHLLYVSFVEDQYMSVFAIALPYTNPFKFNQYIVALAHHVIAMWFLKCRIPFRKDFAKYITKALFHNIHVPREESESSNPAEHSAQGSEEKTKKPSISTTITLHRELMETGLDLMARFTFGMSSNVPKRSPVSEFLLENGQKNSWLVGNKIITITTSSCNTKSFKNGLCERCYNLCTEINQSSDSYDQDSASAEESFREQPSSCRIERKRHRSDIQRRKSKEVSDSSQTKDDLLRFRRLCSLDSVPRDEVPETGFSFLKSDKDNETSLGHLCNCWCTHWAEVHIRRPTGNTSWMVKIQNQLSIPSSSPDIPLSLLTAMVLQGPWGQGPDSSLLFPMHEAILESETFEEETCEGAVDIVPCPKTDPPMRRTNSSPDVNTVWPGFDSEHSKQSEETELGNTELSRDFSKGNLAKGSERSNLDQLRGSEIMQQRTADHIQSIKKGSFRDRGHTISVMSPVRPKVAESNQYMGDANRRNGMNPSFVFLQLFHNSLLGPQSCKPLLLSPTEANNRALNVLDHIPPYDTHKIGVVYVGPEQVNDEVAILSNAYGSTRYTSMLRRLGTIVRLKDVDPYKTYLGGLDARGEEDGKFTLIWHDDVMQVVFHVATFMTNKDNDPNRNEKKKHIANDTVVIIYNESGEEYALSTIKGHVTNACVIIQPVDFQANIVSIKLKTKELSDMFDHSGSYIVSDKSLPVFVRQLALHANLASLIVTRRQQSVNTHVSNWLERLRTIKRLRNKVTEELKTLESENCDTSVDINEYDNFTDYV